MEDDWYTLGDSVLLARWDISAVNLNVLFDFSVQGSTSILFCAVLGILEESFVANLQRCELSSP